MDPDPDPQNHIKSGSKFLKEQSCDKRSKHSNTGKLGNLEVGLGYPCMILSLAVTCVRKIKLYSTVEWNSNQGTIENVKQNNKQIIPASNNG